MADVLSCPKCIAMKAKKFTLDEIDRFPLHFGCECALICDIDSLKGG